MDTHFHVTLQMLSVNRQLKLLTHLFVSVMALSQFYITGLCWTNDKKRRTLLDRKKFFRTFFYTIAFWSLSWYQKHSIPLCTRSTFTKPTQFKSHNSKFFPNAQTLCGEHGRLSLTQYSDLFATYIGGFNMHTGQPNPRSMMLYDKWVELCQTRIEQSH